MVYGYVRVCASPATTLLQILQRSRARRQPSSGTSVVPELVRLRLLRMYDDKVLVVTIVHIGGRVYCSITAES